MWCVSKSSRPRKKTFFQPSKKREDSPASFTMLRNRAIRALACIPGNSRIGCGWPEADVEGRYLRADFGRLSVISTYLPSGSSSEQRQQLKYKFMDKLLPELKALRSSRRHVVICGDWNIAHTDKDLKNWRGNKKNSGFLPEERDWMTPVSNHAGMVDVFRYVNQEEEQYTWWSFRGQAWAKNVGWRIDYQVATPGLAKRATQTAI